MKQILLFITLWIPFISVKAQSSLQEEKQVIKKVITTFFEGFHSQDSTLIKTTLSSNAIFKTIYKNNTGNYMLADEEISAFLTAVSSHPKDQQWEEKLLDYQIQTDGLLASVWTPYEFWYNGNFSHCGVNSFQLFKKDGSWKIIYLIDTRKTTAYKD